MLGRYGDLMILASGLLALLLGLGQLLRRREERHAGYGLLFCFVGLLQIAGGSLPPQSRWVLAEGRVVLYLHTGLKLVLGPLLLFFFQDLAAGVRTFRGRDGLHFLPVGFFLLAIASLEGWLLPAPALAGSRLEILRYLVTGSTAVIAAYIVLGLWRFDLRAILRAPWGKPGLGVGLALVCLVPAVITWLLFWVDPKVDYLRRAHFAGAILLCLYFLLGERYPGLFQAIRKQSPRYAKSHLSGLDLSALEVRLRTLMDQQFVYRDEQLTLPRLAGMVGLSVHQLSRLLNEHIGQNFPTFVNAYRVAEARRLLREQPQRTTLSIGMEVGFNSYTAFHSAFSRSEGVPPGKYRRRNAQS